ncbi:MAG TPA: hypothetical protein PLW44_05990 [Chitinophagales bacterium]|nr:hypothetical protein [Chitinophagales bacterium]
MKKIITLLVLTFVVSAIYSQTTLSFCTYVDQQGYCAFNNNKFITTPDSTWGRIFMRVQSTESLGTKLTYKLFTVSATGETMLTALDQTIMPDWLMAWQPYNFATNTKYSVQIFNDQNKMICDKKFELVAGSR